MSGVSTTVSALIAPISVGAGGRTSLRRSGAHSLAGTGLQGAGRFLSSLLVGRFGGPVEVAHYAAANATGQFAAVVWPNAAGTYASRFVSSALAAGNERLAAEYARHFGRRSLQAGVLLGGASSALWASLFAGTAVESVVVGLLVFGLSVYNYARGSLYGIGHFGRAAAWDGLTSASAFACFLAMLGVGAMGVVLLAPYALMLCAHAAINWPRTTRCVLAPELRGHADKFVLVGAIGSIFSAGFLQVSMMLARVVDTPHRAGLFAAALALATPLSLISMAVGAATLPALSAALGRGDKEGASVIVDRSFRFLSRAAIAGGLLVVASVTPIVQVVWGPQFRGSEQILAVLFIAVLVSTLGVPAANTLTGTSIRTAQLGTAYCALGTASGVGLWVLLVPSWGVTGIAWGYLLGTGVFNSLLVVTCWRQQRQPWGWLAIRIGAALALLVTLAANPASLEPAWLGPLAGACLAGIWLLVVPSSGLGAGRMLRRRGHHETSPRT